MVYIRSKIVKGREYFYLVKGVKKGNNMSQKFLAYIGDKEDLVKFQQKILQLLNNPAQV